MNLKSIMLSERSQTQKTNYCIVPFIWENNRKGKTVVTESITWSQVPEDGGEGWLAAKGPGNVVIEMVTNGVLVWWWLPE